MLELGCRTDVAKALLREKHLSGEFGMQFGKELKHLKLRWKDGASFQSETKTGRSYRDEKIMVNLDQAESSPIDGA